MQKQPIYLDNNATTPCDPGVVEAMLPYFTETFGNAASRSHAFGLAAAEAVERARGQVAELIGCTRNEIVFTSGATEANNLAIKGVAEALRHEGNHIITAQTEHPAVLDTCAYLQTRGFEVTYLAVDHDGMIDPDEFARTITERTILISIMLANNEIGTIQRLEPLIRIAQEWGVPFHSDAVQAVGKIAVNVRTLPVDLMSLTAHKMYGPKGVGALYVNRANERAIPALQMHGGGHEGGMRSGTLNVPGIVGFGKACEIANRVKEEESRRTASLRDRLLSRLQKELVEVRMNGHLVERLPGNLHLSFRGVEASALLSGLDPIAASSGSACTSAARRPSHVLEAIGVQAEDVFSSVRFGIGRFNTEGEIDEAAVRVIDTVNRLRSISPLWEDCAGGV